MFWRCHGIPCVFPLIFLFVLFKPILRMDTWMRATSATVMVFFSKVLFWKLLVCNCIQSSFSIIARKIGNSIFPNVDQDMCKFVHQDLSKHDEMKKKKTKMRWKLLHLRNMFFKERYTKMDDISLIVIRFFFTQTNLVFKSKPMFIYISDNFFHSFINYWLLIFYRFWTSSSASTSFLQKPVKLWWGSMFFF